MGGGGRGDKLRKNGGGVFAEIGVYLEGGECAKPRFGSLGADTHCGDVVGSRVGVRVFKKEINIFELNNIFRFYKLNARYPLQSSSKIYPYQVLTMS